MKTFLAIPLLFLFLIFGCNSTDDSNNNTKLEAKDLLNVAFGNDAEQKMDVYLPEGRTNETKVIVLLHGGSWVAGNKSDMSYLIPVIRSQFPDYAIVNINYRLATAQSPAYPKQTEDIQMALDYLENSDYKISNDYAFIGFSAGAHLSMLYSYKYDTNHNVKAVCNVVGPADFTDPAYLTHPLFDEASQNLLGTTTPTEQQILEVNPLSNINAQSPPTLSFYGGQDPLVPASQGPRLKARLDELDIYNEYNFYPEGGHADWDLATMQEVYGKITLFLKQQF